MKGFLVDENIARSVVQALQKEGYDVADMSEYKFSALADKDILRLAEKQKRIVITHDKDFGDLIHQFKQKHQGVILIRLHNQSPQNVIHFLIPFIRKVGLEKLKNRLTIIREGVIRIT